MTTGWFEHYPHTQARAGNYAEGRQGYRPVWIAIHCTDTPYSDSYPANLGKYWAREKTGVSVHFACSDTQTYQYVSMNDTAFQARNPGNLRGIGIEIVGKSAWHRNEWLAHKLMLRRTAKLVAEITLAHGIKTTPSLLSAAALKARQSGLTCHHDLSETFNGTHTDPAPNFPWDYFLLEVRNALTGVDDERARVKAGTAAVSLARTEQEEDPLMAVTEKDFRALTEKVARINSQMDRTDDIIGGKGQAYANSNLKAQFDALHKKLDALDAKLG